MKLLSALLVGVLVSACSGSSPRNPSPAATIPQAGKWFCQMQSSGESWDCVQDPELAENPEPTRLPQGEPPATPVTSPPDPGLLPDDDTLPLGERREAGPVSSGQVPPEPPAPDGPSPPDREQQPDVPEQTAAAAPAPEPADDLPEYARLAYRPAEPAPLTELPSDFFAVQLIAMPTRDALERFVDDRQIHDMSAARVESNGELYFVLLLGIYESRALAQQAIDAMPDIGGVQPWVRPLGSLQAAMRRADEQAGSSRY